MPIYARGRIGHAWLVDPDARTLEVRLEGERWLILDTCSHQGDMRIRAEPFEAIELDLAILRADLAPAVP